MLSIKNLKQEYKDMLLKKIENNELPLYDCYNIDRPVSTNQELSNYIKAELLLKPVDTDNKKMKQYCDDLSKHRNFDWRKLWNEF